VFLLRKEYLLDNGSSEDLGNKGILESVIDHIHHFYSKSLSSL
jgi:hypothetical protein